MRSLKRATTTRQPGLLVAGYFAMLMNTKIWDNDGSRLAREPTRA